MEKLFQLILTLILPLWAKTMLAAVSKKINNQIGVVFAKVEKEITALTIRVEAFFSEVNTRLVAVNALLEQLKQTLKTQWDTFLEFRTTQEQTNQRILTQIKGIKSGTINIPINAETNNYEGVELMDVLNKEVGSPMANASYRIENAGATPMTLLSETTGEKYTLENQEFLSVTTDENGKIVKIVPGVSIEGELRESQIREVRSDVVTNIANLTNYANETFQVKDNYEYVGDYGEQVIKGICDVWLKEEAL